MDAKRFAAELKETTTKTWAMWSREATTGANGAIVLSPDLLPKFFEAQANNFAAIYADRLIPSCEANMKPEELFAQSAMCFVAVAEVEVIESDARLECVLICRAQQVETLQIIAASGSGAYASTMLVVCEHLNHIDRLVAAYQARQVQS